MEIILLMSDKKYKIYKHTFKSSNKCYIGYTSQSISIRLHKHYLNALAGIDTKFYRAIRKYGIEDIKTKLLYECETEELAHKKESFFIKKFDTFKNGYNMTLGGDGGNTRKKLSPRKLKEYSKKLSDNTIGEENPNYSGYTDDQILNAAVEYYKSTPPFTMKKWMRYSKKLGLPQNYSSFRFNGLGFAGFKKLLCEKLGVRIEYLEYIRDDAHKEKLRQRSKNKRKINKNCKWMIIEKDELILYLNKGWSRGRGNLHNEYIKVTND